MLSLLLASCPASAASFEEVQDNFETVVQAYVMRQSPDGVWRLAQRGTGKTLELTLGSIDKAHIQESAPDHFKTLAVFTDRLNGSSSNAEVEVDFSGDDWKVVSVRWLTRPQKEQLVKSYADQVKRAALGKAVAEAKRAEIKEKAAASRKAAPAGSQMMAEVDLPRLGGGRPWPYYACPAKQCVTIYVSPWCPHCRKSTPVIMMLRDYLKGRGVPLQVCVGDDGEDKVREYAETFGKDTMLDPTGRAKPKGGVPTVYVFEDGGRVTKTQAGFWEDATDVAPIAAFLLGEAAE